MTTTKQKEEPCKQWPGPHAFNDAAATPCASNECTPGKESIAFSWLTNRSPPSVVGPHRLSNDGLERARTFLKGRKGFQFIKLTLVPHTHTHTHSHPNLVAVLELFIAGRAEVSGRGNEFYKKDKLRDQPSAAVYERPGSLYGAHTHPSMAVAP